MNNSESVSLLILKKMPYGMLTSILTDSSNTKIEPDHNKHEGEEETEETTWKKKSKVLLGDT